MGREGVLDREARGAEGRDLVVPLAARLEPRDDLSDLRVHVLAAQLALRQGHVDLPRVARLLPVVDHEVRPLQDAGVHLLLPGRVRPDAVEVGARPRATRPLCRRRNSRARERLFSGNRSKIRTSSNPPNWVTWARTWVRAWFPAPMIPRTFGLGRARCFEAIALAAPVRASVMWVASMNARGAPVRGFTRTRTPMTVRRPNFRAFCGWTFTILTAETSRSWT